MTPQAKVAIDAAMRTLRELARARGENMISVFVHADGRCDFYGSNHTMTTWFVLTDVHEGGALPTPAAGLERATEQPSGEQKR